MKSSVATHTEALRILALEESQEIEFSNSAFRRVSKKYKKHKVKNKFKNFKKSEMIYKNDDQHSDEFTENSVFKNSFFFRTHILWNMLPLQIKIVENYELFKKELEGYLWDGIVDLSREASDCDVG